MSVIDTFISYLDVILFYSAIVLIVYVNRSKFDRPASFVFLYKTKVGLQLMDTIGTKARKFVQWFGYVSIVCAYIGIVLITVLLGMSVYDQIVHTPDTPSAGLVIPGLPIAGVGVFPLIMGWISLFIIIAVHEFAHGVVARSHNVRVKSSGLAFFGPIFGAFVEPDDKQIYQQKHRIQHSIFAAGPMANFLLWGVASLALLGLTLVLPAIAQPGGIELSPIVDDNLPAYGSGIASDDVITSINSNVITNFTSFLAALEYVQPGEEVTLQNSDGETFRLTAVENPNNASKGYIGVTNFKQHYEPKSKNLAGNMMLSVLLWFLELLTWTSFISINLGLINLFPVFITDGAQMLRANFQRIFKDKKKGQLWWTRINSVCLLMILILLFFQPIRSIFT